MCFLLLIIIIVIVHLNEEESENILVDFARKEMDIGNEQEITPKEEGSKDPESSGMTEQVSKMEDEWVEYVDDLGRTRVCRKKELPGYQSQQQQQQQQEEGTSQISDPIASCPSDDNMNRSGEKGQEWERQALKQMFGAYDADVLHYDPESGKSYLLHTIIIHSLVHEKLDPIGGSSYILLYI
jgi:hypothetical protein